MLYSGFTHILNRNLSLKTVLLSFSDFTHTPEEALNTVLYSGFTYGLSRNNRQLNLSYQFRTLPTVLVCSGFYPRLKQKIRGANCLSLPAELIANVFILAK